MSTQDSIATALLEARKIADRYHAQIISSSEISRSSREILLATGWLQEIIRGWYMLVRPDVATGDTAAWYANYWDFVRIYLHQRFANAYCLTPESSLDLHIENPTVPQQIVVIVKEGTGLRKLMHDTSLMIYADNKNFPEEITEKHGINVMSLPLALCKAAPSYFQNNPRDAELALRSIKTPDEITRVLIRYQLKTAASRLIGAYEFLNDKEMASVLKKDLASLGLLVTSHNPFQHSAPYLSTARLKSPVAGRIQAMWAEGREKVAQNFPLPQGLPKDPKDYLRRVDEIYQYDAYNSLSIEGYQVTPELIERVKSKQWDPGSNELDNNMKNAMAAKGYFDAFQQVKSAVDRVVHGEHPAIVIQENLQIWYQHLFRPSVNAGIVPADALFGYRTDRVFIRNSRHTPPPKEAVLDAMEVFFDCLKNETNPAVNAILGHYFFVFIHPYMDGNGRLGRFLMNTLLAAGGYPWTVVRVEKRNQYISTLENTHMNFDMTDFTLFIKQEMDARLPV